MLKPPILAAVLFLAAGGCERVTRTTNDASVDLGHVDGMAGGCDDQNPCPAGRRCYQAVCIPDNGTCQSDNECQNDTYCACTGGNDGGCAGGICVPYPMAPRGAFDPTCNPEPFPQSALTAPVERCRWWQPTAWPWQTTPPILPLVGDLDGDWQPEVVTSGGVTSSPIAIRGSDCTEVWTRDNLWDTSHMRWKPLAIADLEGDGAAEIVCLKGLLDRHGNLLSGSGGVLSSFAEIDGQAPAEYLSGYNVTRYHAMSQTTDTVSTFSGPGELETLFADVDGDGQPELVNGPRIFDALTGSEKTPPALKASGLTGGFAAIADFNRDGKPDLVLVQQNGVGSVLTVSVFDLSNDRFLLDPRVFLISMTPFFDFLPGPPTVDDYDGDGVPDFSVMIRERIFVFALKCAAMVKPPECGGSLDGVLWERPLQDGYIKMSTTFDFNGDGKLEAVFQDVSKLYLVEAATGTSILELPLGSGGIYFGSPTVADADNDGRADIVLPAGDGSGAGSIVILSDPRWMPTRPVWNQASYHITNVNDDLTLPYPEEPSWTRFNNYRTNNMGKHRPMRPDFTAAASEAVDNGGQDCSVAHRLWARICNRGAEQKRPGVPGTFYDSDPRQSGATALCSTKTKTTLAPGECESVFCDWQNPSISPVDLWFRANDDGTQIEVAAECKPGNGLLFMPGASCYKPG